MTITMAEAIDGRAKAQARAAVTLAEIVLAGAAAGLLPMRWSVDGSMLTGRPTTGPDDLLMAQYDAWSALLNLKHSHDFPHGEDGTGVVASRYGWPGNDAVHITIVTEVETELIPMPSDPHQPRGGAILWTLVGVLIVVAVIAGIAICVLHITPGGLQ